MHLYHKYFTKNENFHSYTKLQYTVVYVDSLDICDVKLVAQAMLW